jgi:hypothetical protein
VRPCAARDARLARRRDMASERDALAHGGGGGVT